MGGHSERGGRFLFGLGRNRSITTGWVKIMLRTHAEAARKWFFGWPRGEFSVDWLFAARYFSLRRSGCRRL